MKWLKEKWYWVAGGIGAVLAVLLALVTFGRRSKQRVTSLEAPILPDVVVTKIPMVDTNFNDTPRDDYEDKKENAQLPTSPDDVMDSLNSRFK